MKAKFNITIATLFAALGLLVFYGPVRYFRQPEALPAVDAQVLAANTAVPVQADVQGRPVRIVVPKANVDVKVIDGYYFPEKKDWTLTEDNAQFAVMTALANNKEGNTFIYGHNHDQVFKRLTELKLGDQATVYTDNGRKFTYTLRTIHDTVPSDNSLFKYEGAPILTLQTCSGSFSQNRQLFTFDFKEVI